MTVPKGPHTYIYGPVASRRLGLSLGIDVIPCKTCTFDCIYCQTGRTTDKTIQRREYLPSDEIIHTVLDKLKENRDIDYLTFAGSGEPTLHSELGYIIRSLKKKTTLPVAVITNGSLLHLPEVREACADADLVVPSLDAVDEESFQKLNRPHGDLTFHQLVEGLVKFRQEYEGQLWLEVFLIQGLTDSEEFIQRMKPIIERINPDRIQLNTSVRPTLEEYALQVPEEKMKTFCDIIGDKCEVIARFSGSKEARDIESKKEGLLATVSRRPCTFDDLLQGLQIDGKPLQVLIDELIDAKAIEMTEQNGNTFYRARG